MQREPSVSSRFNPTLIAREIASKRAADEEARALSHERDQAVLEARSRRVDLARIEAERAQRRAAELEKQLAELQAEKTDRGMVITLGDVLFDFNRAELRSGAQQNLYRLVTFLRENLDREILIEGHTDSIGSDVYNLSLAERRAEAVRALLVENGIDPARALAMGFGKSLPVATNDTEAGRQRNRRVEIVILDPGKKAAQEIRPMRLVAASLPLPRGLAGQRPPVMTQEGSRERGGLIAIGGPPFGGKGVLAAELVEWLPRALKLEVGDDLAGESAVLGGARADTLLVEARDIWLRAESEFPPTILLVARFASPTRRRRARAAARSAGMRFLFVEAQSSRARARQRLLERALPEAEARERLERYRAALQNYLPVSRAEQMVLPALKLRRVQSELDAAVARVLETWAPR